MEIKETLELLEGLKLIAVAAKKISADGKLDAADLPVLIGLAQNVSVLADAVKDVNQVPAELKELSADEAKSLVDKVAEIVVAVKAA